MLALVACGDDPSGTASGAPAGGGGAGGEAVGGMGGEGGSEVIVSEDPYEPAPDPPALPDAVVAQLAADIDAILAPFSAQTHSVLLVGLDSGQVIYERDADQLLKPASNTKLFTTAATMALLGDEHRHETVVYATAAPSGGVIDGDVVIVGDHDFTWSTYFYPSARFPLDWIAARLAAEGVSQINGTVRVIGEYVYEGFNFGTYSAAAHRSTVAGQAAAALTAASIGHGGTTTAADFTVPAGAMELVSWRSLPASVGGSPINRISHNELADVLSRHLGWRSAMDSSYAAGAAEMIALLSEDMSLDVSGVSLNDGSGLSHDNRVSARHIVGLIQLMQSRPEGLSWERTFASAGVHGTIGGRMAGADTRGRFRGKTGTLSGVIALSGILDHRYDGQRYAISMLMNNVASNSASRAAHDNIVRAVAADLRDLGARPAPPVLHGVVATDGGRSVTATWSDVGAGGYLVWRSRDGKVWPTGEARLVETTSHKMLPFDDAPMHVRITALGAAGTSDPSDSYAAAVSRTVEPILLVDGNDRWQAEPAVENPTAQSHDFIVRYAEALDRPFDSCDNDAVIDGSCPLDDYELVLWSLGEESIEHETFDDAEQALVTTFMEAGGLLITSGAELLWDLGAENGSATDTAFLNDVLGATYEGDDAGTFMVDRDTLQPLSFQTPDRMVINFPDQLAGDTELLHYLGGAPAAVYNGNAIVAGFPLESIDNTASRRELLDELLAAALGSN